jgi:hypothetical protein
MILVSNARLRSIACLGVSLSSSALLSAPVKLNGSLVLGGNVDASFRFSPDSSRILYAADQDSDQVFELYSVASAALASQCVAAMATVFSAALLSPNILEWTQSLRSNSKRKRSATKRFSRRKPTTATLCACWTSWPRLCPAKTAQATQRPSVGPSARDRATCRYRPKGSAVHDPGVMGPSQPDRRRLAMS